MNKIPDNVSVHLLNFPNTKAREMCVENEDGSYTILVNARLSTIGQLHALEHALDHIRNNDFEKDSVQEIESMAHGLIPREEKSKEVYHGSKAVEEWMERMRKRHKNDRSKFERRWKKNNRRAEMGVDFFAIEQNRLDNLTE